MARKSRKRSSRDSYTRPPAAKSRARTRRSTQYGEVVGGEYRDPKAALTTMALLTVCIISELIAGNSHHAAEITFSFLGIGALILAGWLYSVRYGRSVKAGAPRNRLRYTAYACFSLGLVGVVVFAVEFFVRMRA